MERVYISCQQSRRRLKKSTSSERVLNAFSAQILDQRDIDQWNTRVERDVRHGQRSVSLVASYSKQMARESKFRFLSLLNLFLTGPERKRSMFAALNAGYDSNDNSEDDILFQASSSGHVKARNTSKRRRSSAIRQMSGLEVPATPYSVESQGLPSDSTSTSTSTPSQQVQIAIRSTSSQPSLQQQLLQQNLESEAQRTALDLREKEASVREKEASVRKQELQNRLLELELLERERALNREL